MKPMKLCFDPHSPSVVANWMHIRSVNSARGWTDFRTALDVVERELGDGPYLFGARFTAATA